MNLKNLSLDEHFFLLNLISRSVMDIANQQRAPLESFLHLGMFSYTSPADFVFTKKTKSMYKKYGKQFSAK